MPAGISTPQDLAVAMRYGPQTEQALRRSSYLTDALRQLNTEGSQNIHSGGELAAKLLASAILSRGANKGQDAVMSAMRADQGDETTRLLAGLGDSGAAAPTAPAIMAAPVPATLPPPPSQATLPPPPAPPVGDVSQETPDQAARATYGSQDRDALTRMLATEAIGEGSLGMAAAGHVAMNRLKAGYGGAKSLSDVVYQPHQFEGMAHASSVSPHAYEAAAQIADQILGGQLPDPTGGAMAFLNPDLQSRLGRSIPAWAQGGDGRRIGNHVFFGGGQQVAQAAPAPAGPDAIDQGPSGAAPPPVPFDAGAMGAGADPSPPSAPAQSPAVGTAPGGVSPQAPPPGATSSWPTWKPSQQERDFVANLLRNPRRHQEGVQAVLQMQHKMTQPEEAQITMINGVPFYIPKDPTSAAHTQPIPVPREAMTHIATAEGLGVQAPPGTTFAVDPTGNPKPLFQPSTGQMATSRPGQPYTEHYIAGGPNDPTVPQKPAQGYRYSPNGQAPIPGGPDDLHAPMNLAQGAQTLQGKIQPILDLAVIAKQSLGAVQEGYRQQNGPGDIAMTNGVQHLIDKGVVRGEDVSLQMKSAGLTGTVGGMQQFLKSGGLLTPEQRTKMLHIADGLFNNIDQQYKAQVQAHRPTFDALYGDGGFDKYVMPPSYQQKLGWADPPPGAPPAPAPAPAPQPQLTPGSRDAAIAEARKRGLLH